MIRSILIDDEKSSLESLKKELEVYCPEVEVVAACQNATSGLEAITKHQPDLVFLDIEMPDMDGFEMLRELEEVNFDVIFVTAYDEYAIRAFDFNASDYLLKPILRTKLLSAVHKVQARNNHYFPPEKLDALLNNIQLQQGAGLQTIALPTGEGFEFVHVNDVIYLQADNNYTWVHLDGGKKYLISKTLKEMRDLISFPQFFRTHKSYLVNLNQARKYIRGRGGYLVMRNGVHVPVSRASKDGLMKILNV